SRSMPARAFSSETPFLENAATPTTSTQTPASCNKRFEITLMTTNSCLFIVLVSFHSDKGDTCFEIGSLVQHRSKRPIIRLTRITLQCAIYFCLHRGQFAGKHCKLASYSSEHEAPDELRTGPR